MKRKVNYLAQVTNLLGCIELAFLSFWFSFLFLIKISIPMVNLLGLNQYNEILGWAILIIIFIICCFIFGFVFKYGAPWLFDYLARKLDFPISQMPAPILAILLLILIYIISSITINGLSEEFCIEWLPNGDQIATLSSVCVAVIAYLGNTCPNYEVTVMTNNHIIHDSDILDDNYFKFWITNIGGKLGNIKFLGWCEPDKRKELSLNWKLNENNIHSINLTEALNNEFETLKAGEISKIYDFEIKDNMPEVLYLVFMESTGKIIFRRINKKS